MPCLLQFSLCSKKGKKIEQKLIKEKNENKIQLTMGVILNLFLSISPCSKNSRVTSSATCQRSVKLDHEIEKNLYRRRRHKRTLTKLTRFSIGHGLVMAARSQTVIVIPRSNLRCSSLCHWYDSFSTRWRKSPRFL